MMIEDDEYHEIKVKFEIWWFDMRFKFKTFWFDLRFKFEGLQALFCLLTPSQPSWGQTNQVGQIIWNTNIRGQKTKGKSKAKRQLWQLTRL